MTKGKQTDHRTTERGNQSRRGGINRPEEAHGYYLDEDYDDDGDLFDDVDFDGREEEEDAIVEDSGMEDKIFRQAMRDQSAQNGARQTQSGRGASADHTGAGSAAGRGSYPGEARRAGRDGRDAAADARQSTVRTGGSASRKSPRELNTAVSAIDRRKLSREREQKKRSKVKKIIAWVVIEALTLCAIFGYGFLLRRWNMITRPEFNVQAVENENISVEKKEQMAKGYWNVAIFGVDGRDNDELTDKGLNADVIMIASVNNETGEIRLCSVFRDTYLNISKNNTYNKINAAYAQGGPEQALDALNKNLDLNITNYVTFNWKAVVDGINILQGVDNINISSAELHYINGYITETVNVTGVGSHQLKKTGPQHLDGVQAVAYARLRYMDSDFARTERQKNIIKACFAKAKKADFSVLNNIMVVCFPQVATNISMGDIVQLARNITRYNIGETGGFPWARGDALIPKKGACVIPATLESNVIKLHEFLFDDTDYQPSKAVLQYSEKIKADSKLYKEGKPIDSVRTDEGVIQKPKSTVSEEDESKKDSEKETDENGELIYETDENGERIYPTDADGNVIKPSTSKDKDKDKDKETGKEKESSTNANTRPTDLAEPTEGDSGSDLVDDNGNVISPSTGGTSHPGTTPGGAGSITEHPTTSDTPGAGPSGSTSPGSTSAPQDVPDEPVLVPSTSAPAAQPSAPSSNTGSADGPGSAQNGPGEAGPGV